MEIFSLSVRATSALALLDNVFFAKDNSSQSSWKCSEKKVELVYCIRDYCLQPLMEKYILKILFL